MTTGGFLRSPRVRVLWGNINLTAYNGAEFGAPEVFTLESEKKGPIVYDVSVELNAEGDGPTGTFKWDPTGPAFAAYEWFISQPDYMKTQITVEFYYPGGKKIVFVFVWSGQDISYGNDMSVTVKLTSELAGLINGNIRSTAQAYDEKTGASAVDVYSRAQKQFGLDRFDKLVQFNSSSLSYARTTKILSAYGTDWTFGNNIATIAKQTGDATFPSNIGQASVIIMPPFSWVDPKTQQQEEVLNAATDISAGQSPDPTKRYGYILGPAIINSITRSSNWKPPQMDNSMVPGRQNLARDPRTGQFVSAKPATAPQASSSNPQAAASRTSSPLGTSNNRASLGIQSKDNPYGPQRQNALNDEKSSDLSMDTIMCPLLVGIKPYDILYVPSLTGNYIEDWVVQNVSYTQSNGSVDVNIRATRVLGLGTPMNETQAKKFSDFAKAKGLIGSGASLESWDTYAWSLQEFTAPERG